MVDPITAGSLGLVALASKDLLKKVLGPSSDYLGGELKDVVEKSHKNLERIVGNAARRLGPALEQPGSVSPRVVKQIYDEGRFCEDELSSEYFGGVLASARSSVSRDDRAVAILAVIRSLSAYELRCHHLFYSLVRKLYLGRDMNLLDSSKLASLRVFVPIEVFIKAMAFGEGEDPVEIMTFCFHGLHRHQLLHAYAFGPPETLRSLCPWAEAVGIAFHPSPFGAELFLWACGLPAAANAILDEGITSDLEPRIQIPPGARGDPTPAVEA